VLTSIKIGLSILESFKYIRTERCPNGEILIGVPRGCKGDTASPPATEGLKYGT
jgi:hypothetical protein